MNKYLERLDKLNKDSDKITVYESIDRPIRKLVYHINRIGLRTRFSCCGYSYDGEEEPKSHYKGAYIQFYLPKQNNLKMFMLFTGLACNNGWQVYRQNWKYWAIRKRIQLPDDYYKYYEPDAIDYAIHDYEGLILSIQGLEKNLSKLRTKNKTFRIVDGNKEMQKVTNGEWQVKPKKDKVFTNTDLP